MAAGAATTLFSAPISTHHYHQLSIQHLASFGSNKLSLPSSSSSTTTLTKYPIIILRASSSTSTVDKQDEEGEEEEESSSSDTFTDASQPITSIPFGGGCKGCGKAEIERGCNGEGRIQGGIATLPGLGWWPIKAYRPCPDFVASGGRYRRQGQSMDEVAGFGTSQRSSAAAATTTTTTAAATAVDETQSSEKKQGPRKFKR